MPTNRSGRGRPFAQLLERNARRVGGEDGVGFHLRLDAGEDFPLELEHFRHRLDDQVGGGDAVALEVGDQTVERVAHLAAVVAADDGVERAGALDGAGDRLRLGVAETDDKPVPGAPRGDVAAHGAGADDVHAAAIPFAASEFFQVFAQVEHADQVLRGLGDEKFCEGGHFRLLHRVAVAAVGGPQIDQGVRRRIKPFRRFLRGLAAHARGEQAAHGLHVHQSTEQVLLGRDHLAGDGGFYCGAHVALLSHRIDQMQSAGPARALGLAGQHHGHGLHRADQPRQPHRAAEAGMQAEQHFREAEARVVDGDAEIAGQRHFEPAAEAIAVDHRDCRQRQPVEPVEHRVAARQRLLDLRRVGDAAELGDVGAGDEAGALGGADHQSARMVALESFPAPR